MRQIYIGTAVVLAGLVGFLVAVIVRRPVPPIEQVAKPERRVRALAELLAGNQIKGLPAHLNIWANTTKIDYYAGQDRAGHVFKLVKVTYEVPHVGSASCSFIFERNGKCIFWSKDSKRFWNGGLLDITNDGHLEKVVHFVTGPAERGKPDQRLQVFRLMPTGYQKLLDATYAGWTGRDPNDVIHADVWHPGLKRDYAVRIVRDIKPEENLTITWSAEHEAFVTQGKDSPYWKVLPIEASEAGPCPFHPEVFIDKDETCPLCGHPGKER